MMNEPVATPARPLRMRARAADATELADIA